MIDFIGKRVWFAGLSSILVIASALLLTVGPGLNEGIDFTTLYPDFKKKNAEIFGISRDSINSHEKFKKKYHFPFELLSDSEEIACSLFNVIKMKNMYGKQVQGIERSTFLIDSKGMLIKEWRGLKVPGHAEEVLNSIS